MSGAGSVTHWIHEVRSGAEGDAQQRLWERYFGRVVALARAKLGNLHAYEDEEDIAISAMKSFFMRASRGCFPQLSDRTALWPMLVTIAVRKTTDVQRRQLAERRDVRRAASLEEALAAEPTLEVADRLCDETNRLLDVLEDESLRTVAGLKLEGYSNQEIADRIGKSVKTVERKLSLVRAQLSELGESPDA
jgi:RNA polymerase sigma factor (sigma-70 family)